MSIRTVIAPGTRFGKLVVLEDLGVINSHSCSRCKCDCGKILMVINNELRRKGSRQRKGCGCENGQPNKPIPIGEIFGKLTVIENIIINGESYSKCKCDCGKVKTFRSTRLRCGRLHNCGGGSWHDKLIPNGTKFGELTVIDFLGTRAYGSLKKRHYLCKCSCGRTKICCSQKLLSGRYKTCGSVGCSKVAKLDYGEASFNQVFLNIQRNAKTRNYPFNLTKEEVRKLTNGNCYYCGTEPKQIMTKVSHGFNGGYLYNGIDRVNNSLGYKSSNVVPCCGLCNRLKMALSQKDFLEHVKKILDFQMSKTTINPQTNDIPIAVK